jgi:hypothetical protein
MEWTEEITLYLIDIYRAKEILWNTKNPLYNACKVVKESPVAINRIVTASLSWIEIAFLHLVSFRAIFGPTKLIKYSKSVGDILVKFLSNPLIS